MYLETEGGIHLPTPGLAGAHQYLNAGQAIACIRALDGFNVTESAMRKGLENVHWPARMEAITASHITDKFPKGWEIWLDGAHNEAGIKALKKALQEEFTYDNLYLVWAAMSDKNLSLLYEIAGLAKTIILTRPEYERSANPGDLLNMLSEKDL